MPRNNEKTQFFLPEGSTSRVPSKENIDDRTRVSKQTGLTGALINYRTKNT